MIAILTNKMKAHHRKTETEYRKKLMGAVTSALVEEYDLVIKGIQPKKKSVIKDNMQSKRKYTKSTDKAEEEESNDYENDTI